MERFFLIVDDYASYRKTLRGCLEKLGFQVLEAASLEDVKTLLCAANITEFPLCGAIVDSHLTGDFDKLEGEAAIVMIREIFPSLPIIAASSDLQSKEKMVAAGADVFLPKPFELIDFEKTLVLLAIL